MATRPPPPRAEVASRPGVFGGMPCVRGTRVLAETIRHYLLAGHSEAEIYEDCSRVPPGAIAAVIAWANAEGLATCAS